MSIASHTSYNIQTGSDSKVVVKIAEAACQAEGLHLATWSSSFLLSNLLHTLPIDSSHLQRQNEEEYSIIELGAGTGLTGLSGALTWGAKALLTDLPGIVPGLQVNIDLNSDILETKTATVSCGSLDWNHPATCEIHSSNETHELLSVEAANGFPIVIAADTMYTEEHPRLLSQAIAKCLRRSSYSRVIICYPMRVAYMEYAREFWEAMEGLGLVVVQEGRKEIDLDEWDDERLHEWSVWKWGDL